MSTNEILSLLLAVVGIIISVVTAVYYYQRSKNKRLSAYLLQSVPIMAYADDELRKTLKVHYGGVEVNDLYHLQFAIANTGDIAVSNCIEPLSIHLPKQVKLLDQKILTVHPEGRKVGVEVQDEPDGSKRINLPFQLLNSREMFVIQLLLDGMIDPRDIKFHIVTEDLPPTIKPQVFPVYADATPKFNWFAVGYGLLLIVGGIAAYHGLETYRDSNDSNLFRSTASSILPTITVLLWMFGTVWTCLMGFFVAIGVGLGPLLRQRHPPFSLVAPLYGYGWQVPMNEVWLPVLEQGESKKILK